MMLSRRCAILQAGAALAVCRPVYAHRMHTAYTSVVWNASLRRIAVTHRLDAADARVAVLNDSGSFDSLRARAKCARYVADRFSIAAERGPLALEAIGAELEGRYIFAFQDAPGPPLRRATIVNRILIDAFPDHVNRVNIDMGKGVRTLAFTRHDDTHSVVLG